MKGLFLMTDKELFDRVSAFAKENGWTFDILAQKIGVSRASLFNYRNGSVIGKRARMRMLALIAETEKMIPLSELKTVPVCSLAQAAQIVSNPVAAAADDFEKTALFVSPKQGDFAVVVTGSSMSPWYPPGTRVLVGKDEIPHTGDRVIALIADRMEPVFKVFVDLGGKFALLSINRKDGIGELLFDKMEKGSTWFWVFPIKESLRNEQDLDKAMKNAGIRHFWQDWEKNCGGSREMEE